MLTLLGRPATAAPPPGPAPALSRFEFWPPWLFYLPVWLWVLWLALRHGGVRTPLAAHPSFPGGGLYGEEKSRVLALPGREAARWFAPWVALDRRAVEPEADLAAARAALARAGLAFPLVAKPDLGCRGAGVRPVHDEAELVRYLAAFPMGERLILQELVDRDGEAGVFWARAPGATRGHVISLTLKYFPHVTGDGRSTLRALILADPRAGQVPHLYLERHAARLDTVPRAGARVRLAFAGSHSRGAIFRDGARHVTPALEARFEAIARDIPEFHFGRFDVRFTSLEELQRGEGFRIVEVNGVGAEATHIWDSRTRLRDAYRALFAQWSLAFRIGAANRARGHRPERGSDFVRRWRREKSATPLYPATA